jgi:hypothetical protein
MKRRPLYGGERGIRSREQSTIDTLRVFAKSDFKHDFGANVAERDQYTQEDLERFKEISQRYGITKVAALIAGFGSVLGNNPYVLLKSTISSQIYPSIGNDTDYMDEDKALMKIGFDSVQIKKLLKAEIAKAKAAGTFASATLRIPDVVLSTPGGLRTYEVSAVLMKDKEDSGTLNIASRFENVTGGKTKFAIVIDAASLATSEFINSDLTPLPVNKCEFYILENIENESDSATKLTIGGLRKPKIDANLAKKPDMFFLKDKQKTVIYPEFKVGVAEQDGEALFGNAKMVLSRSGDDTEADFTFADKSSYHVDSVSANANVKNASLNVLASALSKGGKVVNKQLVTDGKDKTPFLFPYLKRVGDWCQALSLLDSSRQYQIYDLERTPLKTTTLDDIRKDANAVVALMTIDRVLLGYALSLGVDVFFTTGTDLRLMIYYRNKETEIDPQALAAKVAEFKAAYPATLAQVKTDNVPAILQEALKKVAAETTDVGYIRALRAVLYRVSVLRTSFAQLSAKVRELDTDIKKTKDAKTLYRLYFDSATIIRKITDDAGHNDLQKSSFSTYPSLVDDNTTFNAFENPGRAPSRTALARIKVIIAKDMYADVEQSKRIFDQYGMKLDGMFRNAPFAADFADTYNAFKELQPLLKLAQKGGAKENVDDAIVALKQFEVTPLSKAEYDAALINPAKYEDLPLVLMQGSYYRDEKGTPYSVLDKYLITEEDKLIFESVRPHLADADPEQLQFLTMRFLILYADILTGRYDALSSNEAILPVVDEEGNPTSELQETDTNYFQHQRLTVEATTLRDIAAQLSKDKDFVKAFNSARNNLWGAELWDTDTLALYMNEGRIAVRNNDFRLVKERITTATNTLRGLYIPVKEEPAVAPMDEMVVEPAAPIRAPKRRRENDEDLPFGIKRRGGHTMGRRMIGSKKTRKH